MPDLASSAITERIAAALDRNTAALLLVATEIAKAGSRGPESIFDWLQGEINMNFRRLKTVVESTR